MSPFPAPHPQLLSITGPLIPGRFTVAWTRLILLPIPQYFQAHQNQQPHQPDPHSARDDITNSPDTAMDDNARGRSVSSFEGVPRMIPDRPCIVEYQAEVYRQGQNHSRIAREVTQEELDVNPITMFSMTPGEGAQLMLERLEAVMNHHTIIELIQESVIMASRVGEASWEVHPQILLFTRG